MGVQQGARLALTVWRRSRHDMAQVYLHVLDKRQNKWEGIMKCNNAFGCANDAVWYDNSVGCENG